MESKHLRTIILASIGTATFISAVSIISAKIGYRLGYCKAVDERTGATECKPSRKWLKLN